MADFIVVNTGRCLLGYAIATELGILRVGPAETFNTGNCNTVDDTFGWDIAAFAIKVVDRILRYKRLIFGVHAAPEKYQHIIT